MSTKVRTTIAIVLMTLLGLASGVYLGTHFRPRRHGALLGRRPPGSRPTFIATRPPAVPEQRQEQRSRKPQAPAPPSRPSPVVTKPRAPARRVPTPRPAPEKTARQRNRGKPR